MAMLVLDLDLTVLTSMELFKHIDLSTHTLSDEWLDAELGFVENTLRSKIKIINPVKLGELIEYACTQHDGIMILTAGLWHEQSIKKILIDNLGISDITVNMISKCHFLTPDTTATHFEGLSVGSIQLLPKAQRLRNFIDRNEDLIDQDFIILDDCPAQINSFLGEPRVTAIHASTDKADLEFYREHKLPTNTFYKKAMLALAEAKQNQPHLSTARILQMMATHTVPDNALQRPICSGEPVQRAKRLSPRVEQDANMPNKKRERPSLFCDESFSFAMKAWRAIPENTIPGPVRSSKPVQQAKKVSFRFESDENMPNKKQEIPSLLCGESLSFIW